MTIPIPDHLNRITLITADEIREMSEKGKVHIMERNIQGEAHEALHQAILQGVPVNVYNSLIHGDLDFTRGGTVPLEEVEELGPERRELLEKAEIARVAIVKGSISLVYSHLTSPVYAQGAVFTQGAIFHGVTFGDSVDFRYATFGGFSCFLNNTFFASADFGATGFPDGVLFQFTKFAEGAIFDWATFGKGSNFSFSTFGDRATFAFSNFGQGVDFSSTVFKSDLIFMGLRELKDDEGDTIEDANPVFMGKVDFSSAVFETPEKILFQHANLQEAFFLYTRLEKVQFIDVEWAEREHRKCVYDEIAPPQPWEGEKNFALISQLYRQLKKNYEEARDYPGAGDFHYGEMEMMRRQQWKECSEESKWLPKGKKLFAWFLTRSYKYLSGYGEKAERSLVIALSILFVPALCYYLFGMTLNRPSGFFPVNFVDYLILSLGYMTFRLHVMPIQGWAKVLMGLQAVLGPLQLALATLALRRKFRR